MLMEKQIAGSPNDEVICHQRSYDQYHYKVNGCATISHHGQWHK